MKILKPSLLSPFTNVTAAFTTRHGGVSETPYTSANLAFHVGDNPDTVLKNHDALAQILAYERNRLVHMRQIHSDRIVVADESYTFNTPPECDALITDTLNLPIMVMSADCTPIILYDPIRHACAAVHAGRAGALGKILPKTIKAMEQQFGSLRENLHVIMGPSIHGCCYEINETIAHETESKGYVTALRRTEEKVFLDVNTILLHQLEALSIETSHIEVIEHCTSCESDEYFSYRADRQKTGRIAGLIILR
jgi:YfiH family protein